MGQETVVLTRYGKPAGMLSGRGPQEDFPDYRVERDRPSIRYLESAHGSLRSGPGDGTRDMWDQNRTLSSPEIRRCRILQKMWTRTGEFAIKPGVGPL